MSPKIAVFSKNSKDQQTLNNLFQKEGFQGISLTEFNKQNIKLLEKISPEVILLDLDLEGTDGIEVCYQLKREERINSFIVLLSNQNEDYIELEAFKVGADDYLMKSINKRVLVKKIQALLKRSYTPNATKQVKNSSLTYKDIIVDKESYVIYKNNKKLTLPRKDFEILVLLLTNPNKIYTREDIYKIIWENQEGFNSRIIDVHIRKIREKVGNYLIETVKGTGYKLAS